MEPGKHVMQEAEKICAGYGGSGESCLPKALEVRGRMVVGERAALQIFAFFVSFFELRSRVPQLDSYLADGQKGESTAI